MARLARLVIPALPHHITQRGNRRQQTFFNEGDYSAYLELMADWCREQGVAIWSYCLMPNHTRLIAVPTSGHNLGTHYQLLTKPATCPRISISRISPPDFARISGHSPRRTTDWSRAVRRPSSVPNLVGLAALDPPYRSTAFRSRT
jgi:REP element-mobilizing transposase RayT